MYVGLDTITNSYCRNLMGYYSVHDSNLCAGAIQGGGKDTCHVRIAVEFTSLLCVYVMILYRRHDCVRLSVEFTSLFCNDVMIV